MGQLTTLSWYIKHSPLKLLLKILWNLLCPFQNAILIKCTIFVFTFHCCLKFWYLFGYCLFHNCLQVLKKLASNILRKFFAPEGCFNPLNLAKLEKLYLVQVKVINNTCGWRQPKQTRNETSRGVSQQVRLGTIFTGRQNKKTTENQRWRLTVI